MYQQRASPMPRQGHGKRPEQQQETDRRGEDQECGLGLNTGHGSSITPAIGRREEGRARPGPTTGSGAT